MVGFIVSVLFLLFCLVCFIHTIAGGGHNGTTTSEKTRYEQSRNYMDFDAGADSDNEIDEGLRKGDYILIPKENGMHLVGRLRNVNQDYSKFYSILKHLSADGVKDLKELDMT